MDEVERVFRRFDADADGKISAAELASVVRALSGEAVVSDEEIRLMMDEMDADRDGFIDLAEFSAFHRGGQSGKGGRRAADRDVAEEELRDAFRVYDLDGDGVISPAELRQVLRRLGDKCSASDCSRMIGSVDVDGDGRVDFEEFKRMMRGGNKNRHPR